MEEYIILGVSNFLAIISALIVFMITERHKDKKDKIKVIIDEYYLLISELAICIGFNEKFIVNPISYKEATEKEISIRDESSDDIRLMGMKLEGFVLKHEHKDILKVIDEIHLGSLIKAKKNMIGLSNSLFTNIGEAFRNNDSLSEIRELLNIERY